MSDKYTLYHGDCLEIMKTLPDNSVDAVITDPPYGVKKANWDNDVFELLEKASFQCSRIIKNDGICFWFSSTKYLPETIIATKAIPYRWMFIWYPSNNMAYGLLGYQKFTPVLVLGKNSVYRKGMQDLREIPIVINNNSRNNHPTQKPIKLMRYIVEYGTDNEKTILDPFMGSGTTGVACAELGRKFIGIEIDKDYFEIAKKRIETAYAQMIMF